MKESAYYLLPPILAVSLMVGLAIESFARPRPRDAEPFHKLVRDVAGQLPKSFGDWRSEDRPPMPSAVQLLRPNVIIQRTFQNRKGESAGFLIVQCKDARDINGHFPPICYPSQGYTNNEQKDRSWTIAGRIVEGREYTFSMTPKTNDRQTRIAHVYGLILMPNGKFVRDIDDVSRAAGDFLRQFYGAAQIQVVMDDSISPERRDQIFCEIIEANMPIVEAMISGGSK